MLNHKCPRDAQCQIGWLIFGTPCLSIVVSLRALFCLLLPQSLESTLITIQTRAADFTLYSLLDFLLRLILENSLYLLPQMLSSDSPSIYDWDTVRENCMLNIYFAKLLLKSSEEFEIFISVLFNRAPSLHTLCPVYKFHNWGTKINSMISFRVYVTNSKEVLSLADAFPIHEPWSGFDLMRLDTFLP